MGHLVAGGTVANIEAMWVARNLKYYPLGLQEALLKDNQLSKASGYQVNKSENKFVHLSIHLMSIRGGELVTSANHFDNIQ